MRKPENKVDDVIRVVSMSCYENRYGEGSHRAGTHQAIPTTQMGLDGLLLLENVTRARNRRGIA